MPWMRGLHSQCSAIPNGQGRVTLCTPVSSSQWNFPTGKLRYIGFPHATDPINSRESSLTSAPVLLAGSTLYIYRIIHRNSLYLHHNKNIKWNKGINNPLWLCIASNYCIFKYLFRIIWKKECQIHRGRHMARNLSSSGSLYKCL